MKLRKGNLEAHEIFDLGTLIDIFKKKGSDMAQPLRTIHVVAAIIQNENKIFATQRGYGEFKDGWEFPGGKIEPGETPEQALVREIQEELDTLIEVGGLLDTVEYDYPTFHLSMECFLCTVKEGKLVLKEHEAARWLSREELDDVAWLPADLGLIQIIKENLICPECGTTNIFDKKNMYDINQWQCRNCKTELISISSSDNCEVLEKPKRTVAKSKEIEGQLSIFDF